MSLPCKPSRRSIILSALLVVILFAFGYELLTFAPQIAKWAPFDYNMYVHWGNGLREGNIDHYYPLPTIIWIFLPLSFMPEWFRFVFAFAPFVLVLMMFGRKGLGWWIFFPLLVQTQFAQLDGWLIFPLLWLVQDHPRLAPLGAVLLMTKPTLAPYAVAYAVARWLILKRWQSVGLWAGLMAIYVLPAFIIDWQWPLHFWLALPLRAAYPSLVFRGVSIWTWWQFGGLSAILFPFLVLVIGSLTLYIARHTANLTAPAEILNLLTFPFLYNSNLTMVIPLLKTGRAIAIVTCVSWLAVVFDTLAGGWGGAYAIIPITALILLALDKPENSTPNTQPLGTATQSPGQKL